MIQPNILEWYDVMEGKYSGIPGGDTPSPSGQVELYVGNGDIMWFRTDAKPCEI